MYTKALTFLLVLTLSACGNSTAPVSPEEKNQVVSIESSKTRPPDYPRVTKSKGPVVSPSMAGATSPGKKDDLQRSLNHDRDETTQPCKYVHDIVNDPENTYCPQFRKKKCASKDVECKDCQIFEKCLIREAQNAITSVKGGRCRVLSTIEKSRIFEDCRDEAFVK